MMYVLIMRAIRLDRAKVEKWFEDLRIHLESGTVPIIEWVQPIMTGALYALYGRSVSRIWNVILHRLVLYPN
jgi:hypothetical protein